MKPSALWLLCAVVLGTGFLAIQTGLAQDVVWADVTDPVLAGDGDGESAGWGDYDNDGDLDLYVTNWGPNRLLRNDGLSGFVDVTAPPLDDDGFAKSIVWIDHDNDGDLDLYLANYTQNNRLFRNEGPGQGFVDVASAPLWWPRGATGVAGADYDADGLLDLYVTTPNIAGAPETCRLFHGEGDDDFTDATTALLGGGDWCQGAAWADVDNDGDLDLYVVRFVGDNHLFRNDDGVFADWIAPPVDLPAAGSVAPAWGDYDNDGDLDLYVANWGANNLLRNDGAGGFTDVTAPPLDAPADNTTASWIDYDNDGDLDLYLAAVGANQLLRNDGDGAFTDVSAPPIDSAEVTWGAAVGDYDRDGDVDIYLSNGTYGLSANAGRATPNRAGPDVAAGAKDLANALYRNDCDNGNHWLHLRLSGTSSNRSAVGARVRCVAGETVQIREVSASASYWCFDSLDVEFGLGPAATVDSLTIRWPSGVVEVFLDVDADGTLQIVEGATVDVDEDLWPGEPMPSVPRATVLHDCYPNPFNPTTTISYELARASVVTVTIVTVSGRKVRSLVDGDSRDIGMHREVWNGRDDAGAMMPTGTYICRLETETRTLNAKVLLVK